MKPQLVGGGVVRSVNWSKGSETTCQTFLEVWSVRPAVGDTQFTGEGGSEL